MKSISREIHLGKVNLVSTESHSDGDAPAAKPDKVGEAEVDSRPDDVGRAEVTGDVTDVVEQEGSGVAEDEAVDSAPEVDAGSADSPASPDATGAKAAANLSDEDPDMDVEPLELVEEEAAGEAAEKHWYILKVQVNREGTIRDALQRRVKLEGLEPYVDEIVVPTEDIAEFTKSGKRKITKRKLYPGYIMVNMVINDDTWFAVRETPGIGDFTGSAGKPTPMDPREVERILRRDVDEDEETQVKTSIPFNIGDHVRVKEGNFQNFEGDVDKIDEAHGLITVVINIFNRPTPVEIQYWQIEKV